MTTPAALTVVIAADWADFARWCDDRGTSPRDPSVRYTPTPMALLGVCGPVAVEYTDRGYYRANRDDITAAIRVINATARNTTR